MHHTNNSNQVFVGDLILGDGKEILLQSMTSALTMNTEAIVNQIIRIVDAGADMVRITARDKKEAQHLAVIKQELKKRGYSIPLIADIHFNPKAADVAAQIVEKVRINPGNYMDKKTGKTEWTAEEYQQELKHIKDRLSSLVQICKENKTTIRIGVNHGSLSERIMYKYGDTSEGMAQSAWEFISIFEEMGFHQLVISLKASNVIIMLNANRILYDKMQSEKCFYPLHLGVTEAGDADDGRIKSALGIGVLLCQSIGDTIRVSLTEEPEFEIPVARKIVALAQNNPFYSSFNKMTYKRRKSYQVGLIGRAQPPVIIDIDNGNNKADYILESSHWEARNDHQSIEKASIAQILKGELQKDKAYFVGIALNNWSVELIAALEGHKEIVLLLEKTPKVNFQDIHLLVERIFQSNLQYPLIFSYSSEEEDREKFMIEASILSGTLLVGGFIDGLWLSSPHFSTESIGFGILQASRQRISKTEYIACPSCGRTLFNIQEKLQEVKKHTQQFAGLKIAVMGCIVNGPGEMADADYGYVGAGAGKVDLYKGQELVKKNIPEDDATRYLLELIEAER